MYVITRRHGLSGADEVLLDPQAMSADHSTSVVLRDVSDDATTVAYGVRTGGKDEFTILSEIVAISKCEGRNGVSGCAFHYG